MYPGLRWLTFLSRSGLWSAYFHGGSRRWKNKTEVHRQEMAPPAWGTMERYLLSLRTRPKTMMGCFKLWHPSLWKTAQRERCPASWRTPSLDKSRWKPFLSQVSMLIWGQDRSKEEMCGNWGGVGLLSVCFWSGFGGPASEPFFPRTSPWKVAFTVTFLILWIFIGAVVFLTWKEQQERKRV